MMKLFFYEFYKLLRSKTVMAVCAIMLLLNLGLSLYSAGRVNKATVPKEILEPLYTEYWSSPEKVNERHEEWQKIQDEYAEKVNDAIKYGFDVDVEPPPPFLTETGIPSDYRIWDKLYSDVNRPKEYDDAMTEVINRALKTLAAYDVSGLSHESYAYQYQKQMADVYQKLRAEAYIGFENTRGWDLYFTSAAPVLFAMAAVVLCAGYLFVSEKSTSFYPIGHASAKGRAAHGTAKFFAGLLFVSLMTLLLLLVNGLAIGGTVGFGNIYNGIQSYKAFTYLPYNFSVLQYLICDTLIKLLAVALLYSLIQVASVLFSDMILSYLSGIAVVGVSYGVYAFTSHAPNRPIHQCNLITLGRTDEFLSRYRGFNLFGRAVNTTHFVIAVAGILTLLAAVGAILLFSRGCFGIWNLHLAEKLGRLRTRLASGKKRRNRAYASSLFAYEGYKLYLNRATLLLVPTLLVGALILSDILYKGEESYTEEKRREYIEAHLYGEISEEKERFIEEEGERIYGTIEKHKEMSKAYARDEITIEEFFAYMQEYDYAQSRKEAYEQLREYSDYLNETSEKTGVKCWYVVESGWETLLFSGADLFLMIYLIYSACRIWKSERGAQSSRGAFMQILLTTEKGRRKTARSKFALAMGNTLIAFLVSTGIRVYFIDTRIGLAGWRAPLISLRSFAGVSPGFTVAGYLCLYFLVQLILFCVLSAFVFSAALAFRNTAAVFVVSAVLLFLPALFVGLGVELAKYIDVTALIRFSGLFTAHRWYGILLLPLFVPALYLWFNRRIEKGDLIA